jgi:hypothetical protein
MEQQWITTLDNPFDPFTQFDDWFAYDTDHGYNTCSYLDRIANTSNELSDYDNDQAIDVAIDEIMRLNITGMYKRVTISTPISESNPETEPIGGRPRESDPPSASPDS